MRPVLISDAMRLDADCTLACVVNCPECGWQLEHCDAQKLPP